jgi:hypothetical protein
MNSACHILQAAPINVMMVVAFCMSMLPSIDLYHGMQTTQL